MDRSTLGLALLAGLFLAGGPAPVAAQFGATTEPASPARRATNGMGGPPRPAPGAVATEGAPSLSIQIPDEPRGIDPVTLLPPEVTRKGTVQFEKAPFKEVLRWLREEMKLNVVLDPSATEANDLLSTEPVTDSLRDEPVYFLLERLDLIQLGWHVEDGVVFLESLDAAEQRRANVPYNLGKLLDAGFSGQALLDTIQQETSGPWDADVPGTGTLVLLGDVLFVRQTQSVQLQVAALLAALETHGRRTVLLDPPRHTALRDKLRQKVTARLQNVSLRKAVEQIAAQVQEKIDFDSAVRDAGIDPDEDLVSLSVTDQPLMTVLSNLPLSIRLVPEVRFGSFWMTTKEADNEYRSTAVYDVRDLCQNADEAIALSDAIQSQTAGPWDADEPGTGTLSFPKPGVLVVRQTLRQLDAVLELLEQYRAALKASKPRPKNDEEENLSETRYYRVPTPMAEDLLTLIPRLIAPESWQGATTGQGTILKSASFSTTDPIGSRTIHVEKEKTETTPPTAVVVTPYSVLIIRQTRKNHRAIGEVIRKVQFGDELLVDPRAGGGMGGMGGGGGGFGGQQGGFGGGFFQVPNARVPSNPPVGGSNAQPPPLPAQP